MKLVGKLAALTLAVATIPLAIAGYSLERVSRRALTESIEQNQATVAKSFAARIGDDFAAAERELLHAPSLLPRGVPSPELVEGMLRVVYHSRDDIAAVWLFDERGEPVVPAQFVSDPTTARGLERHEAASEAEVIQRAKAAPIRGALANGRAFAIVEGAGTEHPGPTHVILAVKVLIDVPAGPAAHVLAADLTLSNVARLLGDGTSRASSLAVLDQTGRVIAGRLADAREGTRLLRADAAVAVADEMPLVMTVTASPDLVLARVSDLRARSLYWLAVAIAAAMLCAALFARELSARVKALAQRCASIARGRFEERVPVTSRDELGDLARSLNKMAEELGTQTQDLVDKGSEIARQNAEIRSKSDEIGLLNKDLERRVDDKTRELAAAQDLILRSRNLAAVGTLGAGMAHEINNPLTGILGIAQILMSELPDSDPRHELAKEIEQQGFRIQQIVASLLSLNKWEDDGEMIPLDLNEIIAHAVDMDAAGLEQAGIALERRLTRPLPVIRGNPEHLGKAFIELLANARRAMPRGGRLAIETAAPDQGAVVARIEDTGIGIKPEHVGKIFDPFFTTKTNWTSTGMGLTMVHKIIEEHHGTIAVKSAVGHGATFTLTFPADPGRPLLE